MNKKLILVTSGEAGGIGPDICLDIAYLDNITNYHIIILGDANLLRNRAKLLNKDIDIIVVQDIDNIPSQNGAYPSIYILDIKCQNLNTIGKLCVENASYVMEILDTAYKVC